MNPDDAPEDQTWITEAQALNQILTALENFADTGSFAPQMDLRRFRIRETYRSLRAHGKNRANAIEVLMEKFHQSQATIERAIRDDKAKTEANEARTAIAQEVGRAFASFWEEQKS